MRKLYCECGSKLKAISARNTDMSEYEMKYSKKRSTSKRKIRNQNQFAICGKKPINNFKKIYKKIKNISKFIVVFKCKTKDCLKNYIFRGPNKNIINRSITHFNKTGIITNDN